MWLFLHNDSHVMIEHVKTTASPFHHDLKVVGFVSPLSRYLPLWEATFRHFNRQIMERCPKQITPANIQEAARIAKQAKP